jgi:ABC-type nitrate/sulfonate/bicarbonate transport system permease component
MKRAFLGIVRGGWLAVTILALWWILSRNSEEFFWPPLTNILQRFQEVWIFDRVGSDLWPSVRNLFVAILLSTAIAVPLGVLLGLWHKGYAVLSPFLSFIWALPKIALLPAFIAIVGIGPSMQITYVVAGTLWPILLGTIDGVRAMDPTLKDVMRIYRINRWTMIRSVLLPGAAPQIFAGLRTALSFGLVLVLVGEMLAPVNGIGTFVLQAQQGLSITDMWAGALLIGLLGYGINVLFSILEKRVLSWHIARRTMHAS